MFWVKTQSPPIASTDSGGKPTAENGPRRPVSDVKRTLRVGTVDRFGREAVLPGLPREGPDCAPKLPFGCEREK
jgi:hypothetical protein